LTVSEIIPGEPERDREAEVPNPDRDYENAGDDDISSGEPGTRRSSEPVAPTTPGASEPADGGADHQ
jgi:hypothetical protein